MNPLRSNKIVWLACIATLCFQGAVYAQNASTNYADNFGLKERRSGSVLNKTMTETGQGIWESTPNVLLAGKDEGGFVTVANKDPFAGRLKIPDDARVITVVGKIGAQNENSWTAIGIGNPKLGTPPWGTGVFLLFNFDGSYRLLGDSDRNDVESKHIIQLAWGKVAGYTKGELVEVKMEYDVTSKTVSLWINDAQCIDNRDISDKGFVVEPVYAGFSGYNQKIGSSIVEKFELTAKP